MAMGEVSSQRILIDKAFSVPKCVHLARMSHHSHRLLRKIPGAVSVDQREHLSEIWGEELLHLEGENTSDFDRKNTIGKTMNSASAMEEDDVTHEKKMELETLLEASGERYLGISTSQMGDARATVWHSRCGIRITQTSA